MTTDSVTLHTDKQLIKMGLSINSDTREKFNDIAPMIILESADQFYENEQIIISNELGVSDLTMGKFDSINKTSSSYDQTHFSITVIDNDRQVDDEFMGCCFDNLDNDDNFNVFNQVTNDDYSEMAEVNEMNKYLDEEMKVTTCESNNYLSVDDYKEREGGGGRGKDEDDDDGDEESDNLKEEGSLNCILKNLLIEPKNNDLNDESVPLPVNACKRPNPSMTPYSPKKKIKDANERDNNKNFNKGFTDGKLKREPNLFCENIQILKIETTKPPKPNYADKDLTSLNWLHKLNIVSVPSLPTPPSSPTFQKNNCKKPNSFSLRLQYGKVFQFLQSRDN